MKILIVGAKGFIGAKLYNFFAKAAIDFIGTSQRKSDDLFFLDLSDPDISSMDLDGVDFAIIASAKTNIRFCEENPEEAKAVNTFGTISLIKQLVAKGIVPVVFSTDYVFDGISGGYVESSATAPLNQYGIQKALMEHKIRSLYKDKCLIIRLSKVYDISAAGSSLLGEMITKMSQSQVINVASDQVFCPVCIDDVIGGVYYLMKQNYRGIYHICGPESISRYELALKVVKKFGFDPKLVNKISLDDLKEPFKRPKNTSMKSLHIQDKLIDKFLRLDEAIDQTYKMSKLNIEAGVK